MGIMTKIKAGAIAATVLTAATALPATEASAAYILTGSASATNGSAAWFANTGDTAFFGGIVNSLGSFTHTFTFLIGGNTSEAAAQVGSVHLKGFKDIDFTSSSIDIDGNFFGGTSDPAPGKDTESWTINGLILNTGWHTLTISGIASGKAAEKAGPYNGQISISPVPEPATWGMMLVGFGLVGAGVRSRKRAMVLA